MEYELEINPRPFNAIKNGTKKVEGRVPTKHNNVPFEKLKPGDTILFTNRESGEKLRAKVVDIRHYDDAKTMLETEGTEQILSSKGTVAEGVKQYSSFKDYAQNMKKYGIYAIEVKPI